MARVRPFRGWRYSNRGQDLSRVTAPPYDVISPPMREQLLSMDPENVVALELPEGPLDPEVPGNRYVTGAATWDSWRARGVLAADKDPALYVLEQEFDSAGQLVRRRAIIAEVALEPFDAGVILPHERTLPKALGDRFELTRATRANLSQVFGLFEDPELATERVFGAISQTNPVAFSIDADNVKSTLWAIDDPAVAAWFGEFMADRSIFIADGHHRYTTALAYRDLKRSQGGSEHDPAYDYVMMALVNMDDPDLTVLPYHRMAQASGDFDAPSFVEGLKQHFDVSEIGPGHPDDVLNGPVRPAFLFTLGTDSPLQLAVLRADVDLDQAIPLERSSAWKSLDVAVVQELVLAPLLGIHPDQPETLDRIAFTKDPHAVLKAVGSGFDVGIVLRATELSQLREVSLAGETMPQKSTYFYPKLLSGLVLRSAE
ncbi:MAG: DUF1015 domain-containing protein [Coriobacteriia bacterium]|nr:DUF1015 domain-containing protein [Coriobacteriia bacterium]